MGPLDGVRVVEFVGTGPGPFCAMMLADLGAEVVRVHRASGRGGSGAMSYVSRADLMNRGRRSVAVDLKQAAGVETALKLTDKADAVIEPYRPGVMERLGLGPDDCLGRNPRLVYGRMTGWGQDGPLASKAGHDINYIAINGVLDLIGREGERPLPPMNLVGDFGGGATFLAFGLLAGILHAQKTGEGQVIDVAMVDGSALLATVVHSLRGMGTPGWGPRGTNLLDTGAPFYEVYETADGRYMSVGAIEPQFYAQFLAGLGLDDDESLVKGQNDRRQWASMKKRFAEAFALRTRAEWEAEFASRDACVAPVLSMDEAIEAGRGSDRATYVDANGFTQPAPAPRFSKTPGSIGFPPAVPGEHSRDVLLDWGFTEPDVARLLADHVVVQADVQS
jgi:alpha-methylacyl-CoA racemase